jgi:hypothetical protein
VTNHIYLSPDGSPPIVYYVPVALCPHLSMKWRVRSRRRTNGISRLLNKVKVGSTERNKPLQM